MIKETYCSFEVAKLLKEKGLNVPTHAFYNPKKSYTLKFDPCLIDRNAGIYISAPTHQMAMAWLREIHGIDIVIEISDPSVKDRKYYCVIWDKNNDSYILDLFSSYEECVEAALKYALENLI